jgi:hypothetical protein
MARNIGADRDCTVYRAVIHFTDRTGRKWTRYEGPYATSGMAYGRVTFWANYMDKSGEFADGHVEQSDIRWGRLR